MKDLNIEIKNALKESIKKAFDYEANEEILVEIPKEKTHGDYASSTAMKLARSLHKAPLEIAKTLKPVLEDFSFIEKVEIAGPGFLNFYVKKENLTAILHDILTKNDKYGSSDFGNKEKIMVEYVSANPTGDLHLGHARGAAYGDTLTRILSFVGYDVLREYYVNDAGNQIEVLGNSLYERYREALGLDFNLEAIGYQGKDVKELAKKIAKDDGAKWVDDNSETRKDYFKDIGIKLELDKIKKDLDLYRVHFDHYQSERNLYKDGKVKNALDDLKKSPYYYKKDGATWLKTTEFGDDKDRVLIKSDGTYTYFTPDIAYHKDKFDRGYTKLVDILGADHYGYIARLKAGIKILGYDPDNLEVKMIQIVRLMENGEEVKMSKRTGNAVTIRELCEDVGVDVARYFPVYYIQYAFARMSSILRKSSDFEVKESYPLLKDQKEIELIKHLGELKNVLIDIAKVKEVNILCNYAYKLAQLFHSYYNDTKVIDEENKEVTKERLALVKASSIVLKTVLTLLGCEAKESM